MTIYLDYMATTPVDPRVIEKMCCYLGPQAVFGNPSSTHVYGQLAAKAIEEARQEMAASLHALPEELIFTSGATEANNLAILGACRFYQRQGRHLITLQTEHKTVLDSFKQLEKEGFSVDYLAPKPDGLVCLEQLKEALKAETRFVSIMHVNNEIGVIQDIAAIGALLKERGILFHVDAAQSLGKLPLDLSTLPVDLMSFSSHKLYGPKGVGALFLRQKPRIRIEPLSFGGGQERGLRSGTLATHQIVGFAEALRLSLEHRAEEQARLLYLREKLWQGIAQLPDIRCNGDLKERIAANLNITLPYFKGENLLMHIPELAVSHASACLSARTQGSYVLKALGLSDAWIKNSLRISLGRFTTEAEIDKAISVLCRLKNEVYYDRS